jgi:UDP-3-O-[3-hydroxymyristoyl] glucosamine N-acyltransferase
VSGGVSEPVWLSAIVESLGGALSGPDLVIHRLSPIETAEQGSLSFVSHARFARLIDTTRASALIVTPAMSAAAQARGSCIVTDDVYLYFARLTQFWKRSAFPPTPTEIHPTAVVHPSAVLGADVALGPYVVIGPGARIGDGARLDAHVTVGSEAEVGDHTHIYSHVMLGDRCRVGARGVIHGGVVIGADGFGFAPHNGTWLKIEQLGAVRIGDDVEIGANSCIDRGALEDTVIENGVKLDNLVQIGHNVHVGAHTAMAGCVGVAGSARIGAHCTVGGGAVVLGHLTLADHVHVSAASVVTRSLHKAGQYTGVFPLDDNASWEKNAATLKQLHALRDRIKKLERP